MEKELIEIDAEVKRLKMQQGNNRLSDNDTAVGDETKIQERDMLTAPKSFASVTSEMLMKMHGRKSNGMDVII